jgi:hypothetical protein
MIACASAMLSPPVPPLLLNQTNSKLLLWLL